MKFEGNIFSSRAPKTPLGYLAYCWPALLFPAAFVVYTPWGRAPFAELVRRVLNIDNPMWTMFNAGSTVIIFWLSVSAVVLLLSLIIAALRVRPWYMIFVYIIVMISTCGIFSLICYSLIADLKL